MGDGPVAWAEPGQVAPIRPCFGQERDVKWVDARKVWRGSIHGTRSGLPWGMPRLPMAPQNPRQPFPALLRQGGLIPA